MPDTPVPSFFCPTRIHMGIGARSALADILASHGCRSVLILVDPALRQGVFFADVCRIVDAAGCARAVFSAIEPEPSIETVDKAHTVQRESGAQLLVALGGGSTIDTAKAVGILATNGGAIADYEGMARFSTPPLPLVAIPSTAGTGSEVSGSCVITNPAAHRKMSIRHPALNPAAHAILDPESLVSAPPHVIAHAGIDAFVHAFESYISRLANPMTDALNLRAIELIHQNLRALVRRPADLDAGLAMLCGASLTGMAFGQTGLGNVHCMARFVGAQFGLSHGLSNGLCLPAVARFNMEADPAKFARLARAMDAPVQGLGERETAGEAIERIEQLCSDIGLPAGLRAAGADRTHFEAMASDCMKAGYEKWNPRATTHEDFLALFEQAWEPASRARPDTRAVAA